MDSDSFICSSLFEKVREYIGDGLLALVDAIRDADPFKRGSRYENARI